MVLFAKDYPLHIFMAARERLCAMLISQVIQQLINSSISLRLVFTLAQRVPARVGYPIASFMAEGIARQRNSGVVRAARLNQWVLAFLRTCVVAEFKKSFLKLGPTEFRLVAILLNTAMFVNGVHQIVLTSYDFLLICISLLLLYFFTVIAAQETIRLAKENN